MSSVNLSGKRTEICMACKGTGKVFKNSVWNWGWKPCEQCQGKGYIVINQPPRGGRFGY